MIYVASVTTTKNTLETSPLVTTLKLSKGVIRGLEFYFPYGSAGLHQLKLFINESLFVPYNQGTRIIGDGVLLKYDMNHLLSEEPYELKIDSVNLDSVYDHTVQIRLNVKSLLELTEEQEDILLLSSIKEEISALRDEITLLSVAKKAASLKELFSNRKNS